MTKQQIIDYVMNTPHNTNPAILKQMLDEVAEEGGGGESLNFSTAEVTLNLTPPERITFNKETISTAINYPSTVYEDDYYSNSYLDATNHKATILLYNGIGYIDGMECRDAENNYWPILSSATVSGDIASWDANLGEGGAFVVTGNGTITASEWVGF